MAQLKFLIDGKLVDGAQEMDVINPATEEPCGTAPRASVDQVNEAVAAAKAAFPTWAATSIQERRDILLAMAGIGMANADELAQLLTEEQGKPFGSAKGEVMGLCAFLRYASTLDLPVKLIEDSETRLVELRRRPLGVVAAIIPWNFPLALLGSKLPSALLSGNTLVVKPAGTTPMATLRFGELIQHLVPPGVVNVIADANDLGHVLTSHPDVRKISFTGSTATGKRVLASAADTLKRVTLELGGNDAGIVLDDADPAEAAAGIFKSAFANSGQVCVALKRLYVQESIYDAVVEELAKLADQAVVGAATERGAQFGPLQNKAQFERLKALLEDTRAHGTIVAGGVVPDRAGYFMRPTVVRDITDGVRLVDEEQFGPLLPVIKYSDIDDAVRRANASSYGLGGSVWSSDAKRAAEVGERLECGSVWINKHGDLAANIPFGGAKSSGMGVEYGEEGLAEFTQVQIMNVLKSPTPAAGS